MNWDEAFEHLQEVRSQYVEIGGPGVFALVMFLDPLLVRYASGERTQEKPSICAFFPDADHQGFSVPVQDASPGDPAFRQCRPRIVRILR